jgi:hypothetical protein
LVIILRTKTPTLHNLHSRPCLLGFLHFGVNIRSNLKNKHPDRPTVSYRLHFSYAAWPLANFGIAATSATNFGHASISRRRCVVTVASMLAHMEVAFRRVTGRRPKCARQSPTFSEHVGELSASLFRHIYRLMEPDFGDLSAN